MNTHWLILNLPLGVLVFALIVVLPYLVMRHEHRNRHTGPPVADEQISYPTTRGRRGLARLSAYRNNRSTASARNSALR